MTAVTGTGVRSAGDFEHVALFYKDEDAFAEGVITFVEQGLSVGEPALVALAGERLDLILDRFGGHADGVGFLDATVAPGNPGRLIPEVLWPFVVAHPGKRVRVVGESIWPGRIGLEYEACVAHESAVNAVFAGHDAAMLCLYDAAGLSEVALADAVRTHPLVTHGAEVSVSPDYILPDAMVLRERPFPAPPATAATMAYSGEAMLRQVRRFVAAHAAAAGLSPERIDELCVVVNELASNTCRHTDGPGRVSAWTEADLMVCQIDDQGCISDPTTGRIPREVNRAGGRGLLMAHRICDLVCINSSADGTRIRVHINR